MSKYMLSGIARCGECGSTMTMIGSHRLRYYCLGRQHRGPSYCSNASGVPMEVLDKAVIQKLLDELLADQDKLWALTREDETEQREGREAKPIRNVEREIAKLQTEIDRLVAALASGKSSLSLTAAIAERESKIVVLTAERPAEPVTKAMFLEGYAAFWVTLNRRHPQQVRATLRKLGVDKLVITKTGPKSWDFEGAFDARRIIGAKPYPETPSLIETDARGYLLNTAPPAPA